VSSGTCQHFVEVLSKSVTFLDFWIPQGSVAKIILRVSWKYCDVYIENFLTNQLAKEFWQEELSYRKQIARQLRTQFVEGISVTLKSTLRVTQGHWKRKHWTDYTRPTIRRVIGRWILSWPWNVGQRSLKAPFDRPYATFYWLAIVNIALSYTIFEIFDVE